MRSEPVGKCHTHTVREGVWVLSTVLPKVVPIVVPHPFLHIGGKEAMSSKKSKIRPLQDRIIVERLAPEEKSSGGIILPDNAQERPQRGRVVAVGKGKVREDGTVTPVDVKEGDEILFGKYSGTEVKVEGAELLIMREDDVLGVVL